MNDDSGDCLNMNISRRKFISDSSLLGVGMAVAPSAFGRNVSIAAKPAILGGKPILANKEWPKWPQWNPATDEKKLLDVMRSGVWSRAEVTRKFEEQWAKTIGTERCLTVVNGTNALITALTNFGVGPGDEVILTPYTFIAVPLAVLAVGAMPVFADVELETFQIDPTQVACKITPRTKAILAVHIAGVAVDMDRIMELAKRQDLIVIEDACQAHLAEYGGKRLGSIGHAGCFSFQNSKNLPIGEGGAVVSNNHEFMDRCFSYHNLGLPYGSIVGIVSASSVLAGTKIRLTEYQAAIGLALMERLEEETLRRDENARYLSSLLHEIPGIFPMKLYQKANKGAFHLYPFRYISTEFGGLTRDDFMKALRAEGVPCSSGYSVLTDKLYLKDAFGAPCYQHFYPQEQLDFASYVAANHCPNNERLCNEQAVWFTQNLLLGTKSDMEMIAMAIRRIHTHARQLGSKI